MILQKTRIKADIASEQAVINFLSSHVRDQSDVLKIEQEILAVAESYDLRLMVLDFSMLQHMTSAFLARLITLNKELCALEITLRVCGMSADMEKAFDLCRLDKIIPMFATEEEAVKG